MQGGGGGWPGQMVEDLALCSPCLHWFSHLFRGTLLQVAAGLQMLLSDQLTWLIRRGPRKIRCARGCHWSAGLVKLKSVQQLSCTGSSVITEVEGHTTYPKNLWLGMHVCLQNFACACVHNAVHLIALEEIVCRKLKGDIAGFTLAPLLCYEPPCGGSLLDWQGVIKKKKKSKTWPHLHQTDETKV